MTLNELCEIIATRLGLEHKATIFFCEFAEEHPNADPYLMYELMYSLIELCELGDGE